MDAQDHVIVTPHEELKLKHQLSVTSIELVTQSRAEIRDILDGKDSRMIAVVGPCSIYNTEATLDYALQLSRIASRVRSTLLVVMRCCFAKPRTNGGWKGLFYEPQLIPNGTSEVNRGAELSRDLAVTLLELGLPLSMEVYDHLTIEYFDDLLSWGWIGARTVANPLHRQIATGLPMPIGMKNDVYGEITPAIDAMMVAGKQGWYPATRGGRLLQARGAGNAYAHLVLRGGNIAKKSFGNYTAGSMASVERVLLPRNLRRKVVVDCSHDNSGRDHRLQSKVLDSVLVQRERGLNAIAGFMLESNLKEGRQDIPKDGNLSALEYGVSLTDSCIGIEETERLLLHAATRLS